MKADLPSNEIQRLKTLQRYKLLDTAQEKSLDEFTALAAHICETPIALVSLVDENRQWFKSRFGLAAQETHRDLAFCAHAIHKNELFIVEDASQDERFADNELVTSEPHIRFYAGAPLEVIGGHRLGTLCVIDTKPRQLTDAQKQALGVLRNAVVNQIELRKALMDIDNISNALLPICAWCRSVKSENKTWLALDEYMKATTQVSHGICPECADKVTKI